MERRTILKAFSLTGGKDPDEVIRHDPDEWVRAAAAAKPIIDFVFENLPSVYDLTQTEGRREAATSAVALVYDVADPIDRDQYLQRLAAIIGTGIDVLRELLRRRMHVVQKPSAPQSGPDDNQQGASVVRRGPEDGRPGGAVVDGAIPSPFGRRKIGPNEQLQDLVLALLLHVGGAEVWPEPGDFASTPHRALFEHLLAGPAWVDVPTAIYRLHEALGDTVSEILERVQACNDELDRLPPEDVSRELDVRRLELRKHRLMGQYQALVSTHHEEAGGLDVAANRSSHEQLRQLFAEIYQTIDEQKRLGVVGTASWSIRRGQEVLGG